MTNTQVICSYCKKEFEVKLSEKERIQKNKNTNNMFCSKKCKESHGARNHPVICTNCGCDFKKSSSQIQQNNFCSMSCAATYNNTHKTTGTRRSKLEVYFEEQLTILFPELEIIFNDKTAISSELDIYIPSLKLAFELNGIFHYEPIFGEDKLNQIQNNDGNKFQKCQENQISLCIIDTSSQKRFTELSSKKFLDIIVSIIRFNNEHTLII